MNSKRLTPKQLEKLAAQVRRERVLDMVDAYRRTYNGEQTIDRAIYELMIAGNRKVVENLRVIKLSECFSAFITSSLDAHALDEKDREEAKEYILSFLTV